MASNFSSLRNARKSALDKLNAEIAKESQKGSSDDRYWKLTVDPKTKVGYAVIRFLPAPQGEDVPWVRIWTHGFKLNGSWYIENCPTTLGGRPCPVCKENNKLWNSGVDADKEVARDRKRKLNFVSNILVVEDKAHPENNGKTFLFRYGPKIHDKIKDVAKPQYPDADPNDPFDLWEGQNFKLKSQLSAGYQNYDKSEFDDQCKAPYGDSSEEALEQLWGKEYPLQPLVAEEQFKNFDDLEKRFRRVVLGEHDGPATAADAVKQDQPTTKTLADSVKQLDAETVKAEPAKRTRKATKPEPEPVAATDDAAGESEDDIKNFFAGVLEQ